ncbi:MAG: CBS domain-containing protein [Phenylobacterium sp.]|uniref:CBS domain-containing protein n=1 Tax=Phenylobacterium sp. TaxID=1871053 RepID=UPI002734503E|nr:CBS domain-containing protein [Phenylobacterium sp.]MDP3747939.1 CBS domain-containing protein [Phenylobacterium sp.]
MTRDVRMANPDETAAEAATRMAELDAGILPVSENDRLVGMITDRDIAIRGVAMSLGPDAKVRDLMSTEVLYCYDDEDVDDVLRNMSQQQIRRLPVLDRNKRLVGIVSLADLACSGHDAEAGEALSGITQPGGEHSQTLH